MNLTSTAKIPRQRKVHAAELSAIALASLVLTVKCSIMRTTVNVSEVESFVRTLQAMGQDEEFSLKVPKGLLYSSTGVTEGFLSN